MQLSTCLLVMNFTVNNEKTTKMFLKLLPTPSSEEHVMLLQKKTA